MMMLHRPLIVSTLVGIIFGDIKTGIIFGAQMELLSMGLVGIGSASGMPEITLGSALCTAFICRNGVNSELALAMALPISSFAVTLGYITWTPLLLTFSCYKALQKKVNPAIIMVLILALGVILKAFNII